jgi:hypothetical protein
MKQLNITLYQEEETDSAGLTILLQVIVFHEQHGHPKELIIELVKKLQLLGAPNNKDLYNKLNERTR